MKRLAYYLPPDAKCRAKHYTKRAERRVTREIRRHAQRGDIDAAERVAPARARKAADMWCWD